MCEPTVGPRLRRVAHSYYAGSMATTTVRLDSDEERILDALAARYGGRSNAIRQAIRLLSARVERQRILTEFLDEWDAESGIVPDDVAEALAAHYDL